MPSVDMLNQRMASVGAWFLIPERVAQVALQYGPESPRRVIVCTSPILDVTVRALFRSVSSPDGWPHAAHDAGHEPSCEIKKNARIQTNRVLDIPTSELTKERYSCVEPDDDLIDRAMDQARR